VVAEAEERPRHFLRATPRSFSSSRPRGIRPTEPADLDDAAGGWFMREGLDPAEAHVGSTSTLNLGTSTDYAARKRS
jgi:hypothetical protein